jgi:hypothetical protein
MLKKLFLSIIILSALASEGGAYFSADLLDYYLVNFARLDMMQDSQLSGQFTGKEGRLDRKGTPAAFYRVIAQNAIDVKNSIKHNFFDLSVITSLSAGLTLIIIFYFNINIKKLFYTRRTLLNLTDSSPPVFC